MRGKPLDLSNGLKECPCCKETKPLTEFGKNKRTVHGYSVYCKSCDYQRSNAWRRQNLSKAAEYGRDWRKKNPERFKDHCLKGNYGLPLGEYAKMLTAQNGKCAICQTDKAGGKGSRFHVDHCHDTEIVRGLLCHHCNLGIGHFQHNPAFLTSAISYLAKSGIKR